MPRNINLDQLKRLGETSKKRLALLGLETVEDLLFFFPFRYEDFSKSKKIAELSLGESANIVGEIDLIQNKRSFKQRKQITEALIKDESDIIKVVWFNQGFISQNLKVGDKLSLSGKVSEVYGQLSLVSPQYEKIIYGKKLVNTQGLVPIYHLSAGLSQKQIRYFIEQAFSYLNKIDEYLPLDIRTKLKLPSLKEALKMIHYPESFKEVQIAEKRLGFDELFFRQIQSQIIKHGLKSKESPVVKFQEQETKKFVDSLPYKLSSSQKISAWEILKDINKNKPMSRLLEGDVGSGKTVVASMALLNTALNKYQSALMVPSEILAKQHFISLNKLFESWKIKIAILTRSIQEANFPLPKNKEEKKKKIISEAEILIGTQAIIQGYNLANLALVVVDEQHRFGVRQRQRLQASTKSLWPHFLSMTATPIPRSLALSIYGDLDISIINELPIGRKKVITKLIQEKDRQKVYDFVKERLKENEQAFIVYPLVNDSETLGTKSASSEYRRLKKDVFPDISIELIHGQLKSERKEKIMSNFLSSKTKILVASSVIELGIDIPQATIMIIEGAERFGLAQLHQFRGRVGRGDRQSYCFLINNLENANHKLYERLNYLSKYNDGQSLAKKDLELRGYGELYGKIQSGFPELKIASLFDYESIKQAQEIAGTLIQDDPTLRKHPVLKEKLKELKLHEVHLE